MARKLYREETQYTTRYVIRTLSYKCLSTCQAWEIRRNFWRKEISSQPVVVEVGVGGQSDAIPLRPSGKAKTLAAAIVQVRARVVAVWRQNHGSYRGEVGVVWAVVDRPQIGRKVAGRDRLC